MMLEFPIDFQRKDKNAVDFTVTIGYTFYKYYHLGRAHKAASLSFYYKPF